MLKAIKQKEHYYEKKEKHQKGLRRVDQLLCFKA